MSEGRVKGPTWWSCGLHAMMDGQGAIAGAIKEQLLVLPLATEGDDTGATTGMITWPSIGLGTIGMGLEPFIQAPPP